MTGASDGLVRWWDIRKFTEAKEELIVDTENEDPNSSGNQDIALSVSCIEYDSTIPAKFMIGTEQGKVLGCTKKAKCQSEYILTKFDAHYGPVRALQRNPCYTKNFLTVGDWSARVWSEDITESCLLWVNSGCETLTDGCWSPTRPSLFFTTRTDGFIEAWDIIETQRAPIMAHKVHEGPAHCLAAHPEGILMCVGGDTGDVSLLELSSSLVDVTKAEKVTLANMMDRESRREKILSAINKEARLKGKAKGKMKLMMDCGLLKKTEDNDEETPNKIAERKFFEVLKAQKDERLQRGKPLLFDDE